MYIYTYAPMHICTYAPMHRSMLHSIVDAILDSTFGLHFGCHFEIHVCTQLFRPTSAFPCWIPFLDSMLDPNLDSKLQGNGATARQWRGNGEATAGQRRGNGATVPRRRTRRARPGNRPLTIL